ncbi:TlpA family protein disulfide reductase [Psychroflexus planctonicus]|uniref:Thioredoxin domain-containing protein n=1 Tax=Psychroflexus planctonicus TaxID=1526575 RepID=A0ABQ1SFY8_9FLAO|nr:hypothetical protein [Psychroflexus planctonicus]GGE31909.1 hypothetical protein GCM10010832_10270 [Psychroflexus planctonicus]
MRFLSVIFFIILFVSCASDAEFSDTTRVYGKIVNPLDDSLLLSRNGETLDTIYLSDTGEFHFKFKQDKESIYFFKHGSERQMLYTKPGDSIAFRLNTLEFDESLSFAASSSVENNFLINSFLLNENNNDLILSYYKIGVNEFIKMTDSLKNIQLQKLKQLKSKHELSPYFLNIAEKSINFEFYDMKERYAFLIQKYFKNKTQELADNNFFGYRENIDFNEEKLFSHIGYLRFLDNYLKNKSIEHCKEEPDSSNCFDVNTYDNLHRRIEIVNHIFEDNLLKERFLKRFIRKEIIHASTEEQITSTLRILDGINLSEEDVNYYHRLAEFQKNFLVGKTISNHYVFNHQFEEIAFHEIANQKPMLIHLWTANSSSLHRRRLAKVRELRNKFPEVEFIGINIDFDNRKLWQRTLTQYKYNKKYEYQVLGRDENRDLYENYLSKVFFISPETGQIEKSTNLLYNDHLESALLAFLNQ